ncbi:hypothetical protein Leryth_006474 [Lithospermum erythrorhizon]|nr:hypothetical protein Leryth_006474 [Lithospermum erythrorhizon]
MSTNLMKGIEEDEEELVRKKHEEALEVQSLRRIISAYLNYPEAAEDDVGRYERSFRRLSPSHKALLSHLPLKYQKLRRCIAKNSYFIFEMLKAFDPPLDMSQGMNNHEHECPNSLDDKRLSCGGMTLCPCESDPATGRVSGLNSNGSHRDNGVNETDNGLSRNCNGECIEKEDNANEGICRRLSDPTISCSPDACNGEVSSLPPDWLHPSLQMHVPLVDVDKVRCVIRNIVRDWASEGQRERDQCYKPILEELDRLFPNRTKSSIPPACLVPGAGLGRLALEISCLGFASQGNEFSYYMMICSSFILNYTQTVGEWTIYPWIHSNCNSLRDSDQLRPISVPDIHPASAGITEGFSMCGGDFVEVYGDPSQIGVWDAVVTCFFLDTAHNIAEYIEIISKILKDGGIWINFGPLLYHFADVYNQEDDMSIEISLEDVKRIALQYGFQSEKESTVETTYTSNQRSMMQNRYFAAFWTMRKQACSAPVEVEHPCMPQAHELCDSDKITHL